MDGKHQHRPPLLTSLALSMSLSCCALFALVACTKRTKRRASSQANYHAGEGGVGDNKLSRSI